MFQTKKWEAVMNDLAKLCKKHPDFKSDIQRVLKDIRSEALIQCPDKDIDKMQKAGKP